MRQRYAHGYPPNPIDKPGYALAFHDEFDGPMLDTRQWIPYYLPHWSSRVRSSPRYALSDGKLVLQITRGQQPWCPEFDDGVKCSSIQTGAFSGPVGSPVGQHRFNPACVVREAQPSLRIYTPEFGYFEARAKAVDTPTNHVALWMIGYEDEPECSGEIAIFEIMGEHVRAHSSRVGYGVHPWGDPRLHDAFYEDDLDIDATEYHVYGLEWRPDQLEFYVDNARTRVIEQSPSYPMQFMLSIYERPGRDGDAEVGARYPREFTIDYIRAYQPSGGYTATS